MISIAIILSTLIIIIIISEQPLFKYEHNCTSFSNRKDFYHNLENEQNITRDISHQLFQKMCSVSVGTLVQIRNISMKKCLENEFSVSFENKSFIFKINAIFMDYNKLDFRMKDNLLLEYRNSTQRSHKWKVTKSYWTLFLFSIVMIAVISITLKKLFRFYSSNQKINEKEKIDFKRKEIANHCDKSIGRTEICDFNEFDNSEVFTKTSVCKELREKLDFEKEKLTILCQVWNQVLTEDLNIPEEFCGQIRSTIGKTKLMLNYNLTKFSESLENFVSNREINVEDLIGFWDSTYLQVEDIIKKFSKLHKIKGNQWMNEPVNEKQASSQTLLFNINRTKRKKIIKTSAIRSHISEMRKKKTQSQKNITLNDCISVFETKSETNDCLEEDMCHKNANFIFGFSPIDERMNCLIEEVIYEEFRDIKSKICESVDNYYRLVFINKDIINIFEKYLRNEGILESYSSIRDKCKTFWFKSFDLEDNNELVEGSVYQIEFVMNKFVDLRIKLTAIKVKNEEIKSINETLKDILKSFHNKQINVSLETLIRNQ